MSLPIHLQNIKSSGVYRFVYDKSVISSQTAETLRLLVGYSDKGPFNTPVYITSRDEFIRTYGNISKRLEKKGIYFHRLALQALASGPILCLNLKSFGEGDALDRVSFNASEIYNVGGNPSVITTKRVTDVYNTNRFWTVNADEQIDDNKYIVITTTDNEDAACSILMRKAVPTGYNLSIRDYYNGVGDEMPAYLEPIADKNLSDYFMDVYVFKGKFTYDLCKSDGPLGAYFDVTGTSSDPVITLKEDYVDAFGDSADVLAALAEDINSGYIAGYQGTTIPFFKNANGSYISIDILFNSDYMDHKMLMNMDESKLEDKSDSELDALLRAPYIDEVSDPTDMEDNIIAYYKKGPQTVTNTTYVVVSDPTAEQIAAAVEKASIPDPVTENDPEWIKVGDDYYQKTTVTETVISYIEEGDGNPITVKEKKQADKDPYYGSLPNPMDGPAVVKLVTVSGNNIAPLYLVGFDYTEHTVNAAECLGVITGTYGKGLQEALTNRIDVEYHYLVDTFDTAMYNDKYTLSALARKKDNCFAILNFPKIKNYIDAKIYNTKETLDFDKVVKTFKLPYDSDGASWCGYFTQVVLTDGTIKTTVPSAGLVSNLFMDKWSSRQPYYIVAGSQYGRLLDGSLVGPDYAFSKTDRDVLEPYGINVIVYEPRRGTYINSEQTAKQIPVSALSKIHIRELVIFLQDEIAELLESYRWELNTQVLRDKIKAKADVILETVKNNGGVYDYLNVCDESNNTSETIDNELLVLDTHIEPARGAGKMVTQIFIYRTGEMRSQLISG